MLTDFSYKKFVVDLGVSLVSLCLIFLFISILGFYKLDAYGQNSFSGNITTFTARYFDFPVAIITDREYQDLPGVNFVGLAEYEENLKGLKNFYNFAYQVDLNKPEQSLVLNEVKDISLDRMVETRLIKIALNESNSYLEREEFEKRWAEVSQGPNLLDVSENIEEIYGWNLDTFKRYVFTPQLEAEMWQEVLFARNNLDEETRQKAGDVLVKLQAGEDFATMASMFSDDTSKNDGGNLGYTPRGIWVEAFEEAAFGLRSIGELSNPIKTEFGYHILKLDGSRMDPKTGQEEVDISHILFAFPTPAEILSNWLTEEKQKFRITKLAGGV